MNTTPIFPGFETLVKPFKFAASPYEYKVTALRECPTPESLQQCETPDKAAAAVLIPLHNATAETRADGQQADYFKHLQEQVESGRGTPQQQHEWMRHQGAMQESPANIGIDTNRLSQSVALASGRMRAGTQDPAEHQALLDQAATLLESLAQHPALQGHDAIKSRLDHVEQILEQSPNTR